MFLDPNGLSARPGSDNATSSAWLEHNMPPSDADAPHRGWLLVASNVTILLAALYALWRRRVYVGWVTLLTATASIFYHLCLADIYCVANVPVLRLRFADHVLATIATQMLVLMALGLDTSRASVAVAARVLLPAAAAVAVILWPFDALALVFVLVIDALLVVAALLIVRRWRPLLGARFSPSLLALALFLFAVAVGAYVLDALLGADAYWICHSLWHLILGLALIVFICGVSRHRRRRRVWQWPPPLYVPPDQSFVSTRAERLRLPVSASESSSYGHDEDANYSDYDDDNLDDRIYGQSRR